MIGRLNEIFGNYLAGVASNGVKMLRVGTELGTMQKRRLKARSLRPPQFNDTERGKWSGRVDSNHRPPGPEPGALARLSHAPKLATNPRTSIPRLRAYPAYLTPFQRRQHPRRGHWQLRHPDSRGVEDGVRQHGRHVD